MLTLLLIVSLQAQASGDWPAYGRDPGGARFSPLTQITRANVAQLQVAWTYHTGMPDMSSMSHRPPSLEVTPIVVDGTMYVITPTGIVAALDPASGTERWRYDAGVNPHRGYGDFASRGVSFWRDSRATGGNTCARRILAATIDARLIALDAASGKPCTAFGSAGAVDLRAGLRVPPLEFVFYEVTSPPAVVGDLVIVGSAVADNTTFAPASGEVRAFDARTGALRWTFDPVPQDSTDAAYRTWQGGSARYTGAANVWSVIVADPARDLVFLPTSSPAPDYYGGLRLGEDRYANSIVALRASTGKVVWHFQTVHHDIWDYDNASPPTWSPSYEMVSGFRRSFKPENLPCCTSSTARPESRSFRWRSERSRPAAFPARSLRPRSRSRPLPHHSRPCSTRPRTPGGRHLRHRQRAARSWAPCATRGRLHPRVSREPSWCRGISAAPIGAVWL